MSEYIYNNVRRFCTTADSKLKHQPNVGQSCHINHSQQQQGEEEEEKFPGLPYEIAQFCESLS